MTTIEQRFEELQHLKPPVHLYALVDGYQYEQYAGERLEPKLGYFSLFAGTEDEPLAHAGPWLVCMQENSDCIEIFSKMELSIPSVSWLLCSLDLTGLGQLLQLKLNAELPNKQKILLRFYDPRVLGNIFHVMNEAQRAEFFYLIEEWRFMYKGQQVWTGRNDA